ncbi:MAG: IreB family regulatory phosphoprotein [Bacillota bacterium]|nr:IreB family regulatory phosphoprotein [Bacillota bacterium]
MKDNLDKTALFRYKEIEEETPAIRVVLDEVYEALQDKGYNPFGQIVGYLMSGDPTFITNHKNARSLITRIERDIILEELIKHYFQAE